MARYAIINTCSNGSTGKLTVGLHQFLLSKGEKSTFFYSRGPSLEIEKANRIGSRLETRIHMVLGRLTGLQGYFSFFSTLSLLRYLQKEKITHVIAGNLHGYYLNEPKFLDFIAKNDIKLLYLMFDEYPFLGKCSFEKGCNEFENGCIRCERKGEYPKSLIFNTAHTIFQMKLKSYNAIKHLAFAGTKHSAKVSQRSPLLKGKNVYGIDEGVDSRLFVPMDTTELKKSLGITSEQIVCVCIALFNNINHPKGAAYFIKLAQALENDPRYVFVHIGYLLKDRSFLPKNYITVGFVNDQVQLARYYSLADLHVLPALGESMPTTCLESLSCGSPLLCFDYGGIRSIAPEDIATFVEPYNVDALKEAVLKTRKKDQSIINRCRNYAIERYDDQKYFGKVFEISETL